MKKFLFSAIALTAFSLSALANNEVRDNFNKNVNFLKTTEFCDSQDTKEINYVEICDDYAINTLTIIEAYSPCELSVEDMTEILNVAYAHCKGYTDIKNF